MIIEKEQLKGKNTFHCLSTKNARLQRKTIFSQYKKSICCKLFKYRQIWICSCVFLKHRIMYLENSLFGFIKQDDKLDYVSLAKALLMVLG